MLLYTTAKRRYFNVGIFLSPFYGGLPTIGAVLMQGILMSP